MSCNPMRDGNGYVLGSLINARVTLADTGGLFELLEYTAPLGAGQPIHKHEKEIEAFYVIDGEVTMLVGELHLRYAGGTEEVTREGDFFLLAPRPCHLDGRRRRGLD